VTVLLQALIGTRIAGHTLIDLPRWELPSWTSGLTVGGPVTVQCSAHGAPAPADLDPLFIVQDRYVYRSGQMVFGEFQRCAHIDDTVAFQQGRCK